LSRHSIKVRELGEQEFVKTWLSMKNVVLSKDKEDSDEVWLLEHKPVFTLGFSASKDNFLETTDIPVVRTDRGGQVTYHGPGQLVVYFILNLRRLGWGPKKMIFELENIVMDLLTSYKIEAHRGCMPGVFIGDKKIASIGLKIKKGFSYHGISLNIDMDLAPFSKINTCGVSSMEVTQLKDHVKISKDKVASDLKDLIKRKIKESFE